MGILSKLWHSDNANGTLSKVWQNCQEGRTHDKWSSLAAEGSTMSLTRCQFQCSDMDIQLRVVRWTTTGLQLSHL